MAAPSSPQNVGPVTQLLLAIRQGQARADDLLPVVYDELRRLAAQRLAHEAVPQTLQPTALVHEAYLRLVGSEVNREWDSRGHFFAAAAEAMRRILIDSARRKNRIRHGGEFHRVDLLECDAVAGDEAEELLALDEVLAEFEKVDPPKAQLVKLRYFAGLSESEAAEVLGISRATASRHWAFARAWLYDRLRKVD